MIIFDVRADIKEVEQYLSRLAKDQIPYATARALTFTAKAIEKEIRAEIGRVFDRPTPYTRGATWVRTASKHSLWSEVRIKDEAVKGNPAIRYLIAEITGGGRSQKGFEKLLERAGVMPAGWFAIPASGATLDAYGNVPASLINRVLSQLQAARDPKTNETRKAKKRRDSLKSRVKARGGRFFVAYPDRPRTKHLRPGIYERTSFAFGSAVRPVFIYTQKRPRYRKRLRFYEIADDVGRMRWPLEFRRAATEAIRTAME